MKEADCQRKVYAGGNCRRQVFLRAEGEIAAAFFIPEKTAGKSYAAN